MIVNTSLYSGPLAIVLVLAGCLAVVSVVAVIRSQRRKPVAGRETLVGQTAVVRTPLTPEGIVLADGELWQAVSSGPHIDAGHKVRIVAVEGLMLKVVTKEDQDV